MRGVIDEFRPDVIHFTLCDWFLANLVVYLSTHRRKIAHIYTIFYHEFERTFSLIPFIWVNSYLTRHVAAVHVASETARRKVVEKFKTPLDRIRVIPLGADSYKDVRVEVEGESRCGLTILSVGRLSRRKGQMQLLAIFKELLVEISPPPRLILVGGEGGQMEEVLKYIEENCLGEAVRVTGHVTDGELQQIYMDSDIFVLLTEDESFGLVFTEAMAWGLPVITYKVGALPEVLSEGAILVNRFDVRGVRDALRILLTDHKKRQEMSQRARSYVTRKFAWRRSAEEMLGLYREAVRLQRGASATIEVTSSCTQGR